jgi:putative PIN family toxin of toxin-antitoxin system
MSAPTIWVIDTNTVLDLLVFEDPATAMLRDQLAQPGNRWIATAAMREELARVLAYPQITKRLSARALPAADVLAAFDQRTRTEPVAPKAPYVCKDADDQMFIDLAVAHRATLVSKDDQVLRMARRLAPLGVLVCRRWPVPIPVGPLPAVRPLTAA